MRLWTRQGTCLNELFLYIFLYWILQIDIAERMDESKTDTTLTDSNDLLRDTSTLLKQVQNLTFGQSLFRDG